MTLAGRRGVVLYLVLGVLATVGSILFLLHASFTTWEGRLHVDTDEVTARHLSYGAVQALLFAVEQDLDLREGRAKVDLIRGRLGEVLLGDERSLARAFDGGDRPGGARALLGRLLGEAVFGRIDELTKPWPNVQLNYRVIMKVVPPAAVTALADPVPKAAVLHLECTCQLNHARRVAQVDLQLAVGSTLPGVLGRFTLAWTPAASTDLYKVSRQGGAVSAFQPIVCFNDPADYHPADPLWTGKAEPARALTVPGFSKIDELEKTLAGRGAVFLSGADAAHPLVMQLAAGGPPAGQDFQMFNVTGAKPYAADRQPVASAPARIQSMHPTQPGTTVRQNAWIEGVVTGYYAGVDGRGQLGADAEAGPMADGSSYLRPLGTAAHPSLGLVYGHARARLAAVSNLAVDRDMTSRDEALQTRAAGFALPVAEVREPPLKRVTAASFAAEVAREAAQTPLQDLFFFGSELYGPGTALNGNMVATSDSGATVMVSSERAWPRITLLRSFYRYGKMFASYAEYEQVMSRKLELAYNALLRLPPLDPAAAEAQLMKLAFAHPAPPDDADMLAVAHMEHTDPVHQQLGETAFVDSKRATQPDAALGALVAATIAGPRVVRQGVTCRGLELFRASFLTGAVLDLSGSWVSLVGATSADSAPALDVEKLSVAPLGGGVLEVASLALSGLANTGTGAQLEPLVVKAGTLRLKGLGPYEGTFIVSDRLEVVAGPEGHAVIRGNLVLGSGAVLDLKAPVAVVRDPALDPTGAQAHLYYRGRVDAAWDGRLAGGPDLIGRNPYRRAAP